MGTAGALFYLKTLVDKAFILLFGDIFLNMDFSRMIRFHQERMPPVSYTHLDVYKRQDLCGM